MCIPNCIHVYIYTIIVCLIIFFSREVEEKHKDLLQSVGKTLKGDQGGDGYFLHLPVCSVVLDTDNDQI